MHRYIQDWIDKGWIKGGKALDVGCGPGSVVNFLAEAGFEVEAIDKFDQKGFKESEKVRFKQIDLRDFDFGEEKYDLIHARHVLHFLGKEEIRESVGRMLKGVKNGGILYITLSGDRDGWVEKSKGVVTFLTETELVTYVESELPMPVEDKMTRLNYSTTTSGIVKYTHTIFYTVIKGKKTAPLDDGAVSSK